MQDTGKLMIAYFQRYIQYRVSVAHKRVIILSSLSRIHIMAIMDVCFDWPTPPPTLHPISPYQLQTPTPTVHPMEIKYCSK